MVAGPRRVLTLVGLQLAAAGLLFELVLRLALPHSAAVRDVVERPRDRVEHAGVRSLPELLDRSALGHQPGGRMGGFVLNSKGFRTPEYELVKPAGVWRILALGDSFTFASGGVPHSLLWPTLVGEAVADASGRPVEVINLGVPAVGPSFSRRLWQLEGARLDADVVLFGFFVGNDFTDEQWAVGEHASDSLPMRSLALRALVRLVGAGEQGPPRLVPPPPPPPLPPGVQPGFEVPGYVEVFASRAPLMTRDELLDIEGRALAICARGDEERFERLLAHVGRVLEALRDEVHAAGARLAVVVIPARYQVNPDDLADVVARLGQGEDDYDIDRLQRGLLPVLGRAGIPCVDLLPGFREAAASKALYTVGDTHWSVEGNALAAQLVMRTLGSRLAPADGPDPTPTDTR
ncbi:MAG: SGNH/GDSL hydrolase family protein [Planctomycetota bacterium]|jgi:hypothetical protein